MKYIGYLIMFIIGAIALSAWSSHETAILIVCIAIALMQKGRSAK